MHDSYLEVTFRHGRVLAAYYYLPRESDSKIARSEIADSGLVVDYAVDDVPLGIEITAPTRLTLRAFNAVLEGLGHSPVEPNELSPLAAA